jgi:multidrug resistance efflux pump
VPKPAATKAGPKPESAASLSAAPAPTAAPAPVVAYPQLEALRQFAGNPKDYLGILLEFVAAVRQVDGALFVKIGAEGATVAHRWTGGGTSWLMPLEPAILEKAMQVMKLRRPVQLAIGDGQARSYADIRGFADPRRGIVLALISRKPFLGPQDGGDWLLDYASGLLDHYEARMTLANRTQAMERMKHVFNTFVEVNRQEHFAGLSLAFCNKIAVEWNCERVSLGLAKGRNVQVKSISMTENFTRKMKLVLDLEAAMEEAFDQDREIIFPALRDAPYSSRFHEEFSKSYGHVSVLSLPLRDRDKVLGVVLLERSKENPITPKDVETLRLACDLVTPRLVDLKRTDGFLRRRWAELRDRPLETLFGPKYSAVKFTALVTALVIVFFALYRTEFQPEAKFRIEVSDRVDIVSPEKGVIERVHVKPGDKVKKGQVLVELDRSEIFEKVQSLRYEMISFEKEASVAREKGKYAEIQLAEAKLEKCRHEYQLNQLKLERLIITAPIDGTIISEEDLSRLSKPSVDIGQALFTIGSPGKMEAVLEVNEGEITYLFPDQKGELSTLAYPDRRIGFRVTSISPIAAVKNQDNSFRVKGRIEPSAVDGGSIDWLKPGMEGVARVDAGQELLIWIWTRKGINWLRSKLWI